jgi:hypothetical protein
VTATALSSRLDQVAELAAQLDRRPTSNEVRRSLGCGRDVANRLLAELDGPPATPGPDIDDETTAAPVDGNFGEVTGVSGRRGPAPVDVESAAGPDTGHPPAASRATWAPAHRGWLILLALPAFVAIWSGWVGLGGLAGFGLVHPLPGIADGFTLNSAITLPIGVETYAAYALRVWLAGAGSDRARRFARASAIGSLVLGAAGQVAYHLMTARHVTSAPWPITTAVACLPVVVLGFGAALLHLTGEDHRTTA